MKTSKRTYDLSQVQKGDVLYYQSRSYFQGSPPEYTDFPVKVERVTDTQITVQALETPFFLKGKRFYRASGHEVGSTQNPSRAQYCLTAPQGVNP